LDITSRDLLEDTLDPELKDESRENMDLNTESYAYTEAPRTKKNKRPRHRSLIVF